jgi:hypothetical protein
MYCPQFIMCPSAKRFCSSNLRDTRPISPERSNSVMCAAIRHVRFTPDNDRESRFPHKIMPALPPKANIFADRGESKHFRQGAI